MRHLLLSTLLLLPCTSQAEPVTTLHLGAADWCPYTCKDPDKPGIAAEYLTAVFATQGIDLQISVLPWARAVQSAQSGELDGLVTLIEGEAPQLLMTTTPTMGHQNCFYTRPASQWHYQGLSSLDQVRLGAIKNYGYGDDIDYYIATTGESTPKLQVLSGNSPDERLVNMLINSRIDVFISDRYVFGWKLKGSQTGAADIQQSSCLPERPFYAGFFKGRKNAQALTESLNKALSEDSNKALREQIAAKYR